VIDGIGSVLDGWAGCASDVSGGERRSPVDVRWT
jgi:hypothetical protein